MPPRHRRSPAGVPAPTEPTIESNPEAVKPWKVLFAANIDTYRYSVKAWYTHGRARIAGGNPLDPREPKGLSGRITANRYNPGEEVDLDLAAACRFTARMVDLANSGGATNAAANGASGRGKEFRRMTLEELHAEAAKFGTDETERERTARLTGMRDASAQLREVMAEYGLSGAYDLAELTHEERVVTGFVMDGKQGPDIVTATGKALGTVKVLRARALHKLRALTDEEAA